jgi:hypothetical protein
MPRDLIAAPNDTIFGHRRDGFEVLHREKNFNRR